MKNTLFALILSVVCLFANESLQKQLDATLNNVNEINHAIFTLAKNQSLGCPSSWGEPMYYRGECVQHIDKIKQGKLIAKIQQAIEYFKINSIDVLTTKTTNEVSYAIFKDGEFPLNQEATLEASVRYLKESEHKDYKAVYIYPKVVNGKYIVGQIMYGKID
jgi:hypothetical protein